MLILMTLICWLLITAQGQSSKLALQKNIYNANFGDYWPFPLITQRSKSSKLALQENIYNANFDDFDLLVSSLNSAASGGFRIMHSKPPKATQSHPVISYNSYTFPIHFLYISYTFPYTFPIHFLLYSSYKFHIHSHTFSTLASHSCTSIICKLNPRWSRTPVHGHTAAPKIEHRLLGSILHHRTQALTKKLTKHNERTKTLLRAPKMSIAYLEALFKSAKPQP